MKMPKCCREQLMRSVGRHLKNFRMRCPNCGGWWRADSKGKGWERFEPPKIQIQIHYSTPERVHRETFVGANDEQFIRDVFNEFMAARIDDPNAKLILGGETKLAFSLLLPGYSLSTMYMRYGHMFDKWKHRPPCQEHKFEFLRDEAKICLVCGTIQATPSNELIADYQSIKELLKHLAVRVTESFLYSDPDVKELTEEALMATGVWNPSVEEKGDKNE